MTEHRPDHRMADPCSGAAVGPSDPSSVDAERFELDVDFSRRTAFTTRCRCGWTSEPTFTAGLAESMWDTHVRIEHRAANAGRLIDLRADVHPGSSPDKEFEAVAERSARPSRRRVQPEVDAGIAEGATAQNGASGR